MSEWQRESADEGELGNGGRPRWSLRLDRLISSLSALLSTRSEIAGAELAEKASYLGRGLAGAVIAAILGFLAFLLAAGLLAAVFARILGSAWAGVLVTLVLYAVGAAGAAMWAVRQLGRVRPLEFPMTSREIARDWEVVRRAAGVEPEPAAAIPAKSSSTRGSSSEDLEERLRGLE
jgi:uncharacterized membrane protein YqjE